MKLSPYLLILIIVLLILAATSCRSKAQETVSIKNSDINLELLFEHDGCKVYRFIDGGHAVYWTDCSGQIENYWSTHSGKSTIHHSEQSITTP